MILTFLTSVTQSDFTAPPPPPSVEMYLPSEVETFGDGLWYVIKNAIADINPSIAQAGAICLSLIAVTLLISLMESFSGASKKTAGLIGVIAVTVILLKPSNALVNLGIETVQEMSAYGKLLLPVMTAALAAQGGATSSAALYAGTAFFDAILTSGLTKLIVPIIYIYMALCVADCVTGDELLKSLSKLAHWIMTWALKLMLYIFTGYIGITGVVSGSADAAAVKAVKLAITGAVPVVGSIISDASETILVSVGLMKSTAGVFGLLVVLAMWIGPFLEISIQYILLKITAAVCGVLGSKSATSLIKSFSGIMGFLLAATGAMCLLLFISTVCFMKGVS